MRTIWMNDGLADDLMMLLAREPTDMVVVDCMLAGILRHLCIVAGQGHPVMSM